MNERLESSYDFGDDDIPLPDDPRFDAWLAARAPSLNEPPAAPAAEMWQAIAQAQVASRAAGRGEVAGVTPLRPRWIWPAAVAAALLAGIGIDRLVLRPAPPAFDTGPAHVASATARVSPPLASTVDSSIPLPSGVGAATPGSGTAAAPTDARVASSEPSRRAPVAPDRGPRERPADARDAARLYRLAAVQTLSQAEALLTAYRASDLAGRSLPATRQLGLWGREVLSSTRLLMDSPAGDDPQLRPLLDDLELVLVQIVRLSGEPLDASDRALIDRSLRDSDLLPRIRTAVPAGTSGAASDE